MGKQLSRRGREIEQVRKKERVGERAVKPEKHNKKFMSFTRNAKLKQKVQIMNDERTKRRRHRERAKRGAREIREWRLETSDDWQK